MIQDCFDCYSTRYGTDYVGTTNTTISGRQCQRWDAQTPHAHGELLFPDATISDANNYCRNPDQEKTQRGMPWCYTTDPDVEWEYCTVPRCDDALDDCTPIGAKSWKYAGIKNVTKYGIPCDFWSDHPPPVTQELFSVGNIKQGRLYALSGGLTEHGLITDGQCYRRTESITERCTDPVVYGYQGDCNGTLTYYNQWNLLDVATACELPANATAVDGCCLNKTKSCHLKNVTDWCTNQLGDDCEVAVCCETGCCASASNSCCLASSNVSLCCNASMFECCTDVFCTKTQTICYEPVNFTGYSFADHGRKIYDADHQPVTGDFISCYLNITADLGKMTEPIDFGRRSAKARNYCRNPDNNVTGPWCYVTMGTTVIRQSCDIPFCTAQNTQNDCRQTYDGFDYRGEVSRTLSGYTCQRWDTQEPRSHIFNESSYFPEGSVSDASNYCRNPDRQLATGPWCFTPASIENETCGIPLCTAFSVPNMQPVIPLPPAPIYTLTETSTDSTEGPSYTTPASVAANQTGNADSSNVTITKSNITSSGGSRSSRNPITVRCDYHLYRSVSRYNQSLWKMTHKFINSLRNLQKTNIDPDGIPHYIINQTMLQLVEANIGHQCAWCVNTDGKTPFLDIVRERLDQWKSVALKGVTVDVLANVEETMAGFFQNTSSWDVGQPIVTDDVEAVRAEFRNAASSVKEAVRITQQTMYLVKEATYLNRELLTNIWELECKVQLQKLLDEYHRYRQTFRKVIGEFRVFVKSRTDELRARIRRYTSDAATLEAISRETNFIEMRLKLLGAKITIDKSLDKGQLLLTNIQSQINKIYYSIMSYVEREHIKSRSAYWRHLNVTDPGVKLPTLQQIRGIMMANVDYGMVPDSAGLEKWARKVSSLDAMRLAMERYIRILMDVALADGRDYLKGYLKGNQIDEEFYRQNFLQVELFYQEMANRKVIEEAVYTTGDLFSEVGGLSGLLLGASVQSFVELFDFLAYFIWKKCKKLKGQ